MWPRMKHRFPAFVLLCLFALHLLAACAHSAKVRRYIPAQYSPTTSVEVFATKGPSRDYIELAELSVKADDESVHYLTEKAKELGADAIILTGEQSRGSVMMPAGNMWVAVPVRKLAAVAIKYK
jgi:hypothetical protein